MGAGPVDIIMVPGLVSHVEFMHELVGFTSFLRRLATFARVVTFDKRGQGLSDRISGAPSLEQRNEIGSARAVLLGFSEGSAMSVLFAATYPERVSHVVLFGVFAKGQISEEGIAERVKASGRRRHEQISPARRRRRTRRRCANSPSLNVSPPRPARSRPI